ncbi:MAG: ATP-binding cassette domain-containing protein [Pirellulaceae bacterium]
MKPPIRIKNLLVTRANTTICDISELTIEHGMCLGIQGLNGSGKSTLLRVLAGLESEYSGLVDIPALYHPVGFVQQSPFLFKGTVQTNLLYGAKARNIDQAQDKAAKIATLLEVHSLLNRDVKNLSGGEKRRIALGRTIILSPSLLLLDEPFTEMDSSGIELVCHYLRELQTKYSTTLVIASPTPLPESLASDRIVTIG